MTPLNPLTDLRCSAAPSAMFFSASVPRFIASSSTSSAASFFESTRAWSSSWSTFRKLSDDAHDSHEPEAALLPLSRVLPQCGGFDESVATAFARAASAKDVDDRRQDRDDDDHQHDKLKILLEEVAAAQVIAASETDGDPEKCTD